ncbi:hypothetical protein LTR37_009524 [Vermiconidia calcicola]|uniref:Uncharacterized protein n=1 Tax=Vermiconidia calcicola TaxID=1690605 RepID=A0ACC3N7E4_9PEZI|nr:hypothetical protein LTR37_009524 [Vermiconidia calcicola]
MANQGDYNHPDFPTNNPWSNQPSSGVPGGAPQYGSAGDHQQGEQHQHQQQYPQQHDPYSQQQQQHGQYLPPHENPYLPADDNPYQQQHQQQGGLPAHDNPYQQQHQQGGYAAPPGPPPRQQQRRSATFKETDFVPESERGEQREAMEHFEMTKGSESQTDRDVAQLQREYPSVDGSLVAAIYSDGGMGPARETLQELASST